MKTEKTITNLLESLKKFQNSFNVNTQQYQYLQGQIETIEWVLK